METQLNRFHCCATGGCRSRKQCPAPCAGPCFRAMGQWHVSTARLGVRWAVVASTNTMASSEQKQATSHSGATGGCRSRNARPTPCAGPCFRAMGQWHVPTASFGVRWAVAACHYALWSSELNQATFHFCSTGGFRSRKARPTPCAGPCFRARGQWRVIT